MDDGSDAAPPRPARSLASDAAVLAIGSLFTQAAGLVSVMILARLLPKAELGGYQQLLLIYGIASPLLIGGIPAAIQFFVPRETDVEQRRRWIFDAYATLAALGLVGAGMLFALRHPIAEALGNPDLHKALALYAPFVFFSFVNGVMPNALIVDGRARAAAVLGALNAALWLVLLTIAAVAGESAEAAAIGLSASAALATLIGTTYVVRTVGVRAPRSVRELRWRRLLLYGIPLALTGVVSMLGFQLDRLVVARNFSPERFAVYAVGAIEVPLAILVRQSINSVLVPAMSERHGAGDLAGMAELWRGTLRKSALIILPAFALLMALAPEVIRVAFGERYEESADIFRIYLLMMPIGLASWGLIPMAAGRPGYNIGGSLVLLAINGALAVALVGPLGLYGPAIATPVAVLATAVYFVVRIRRLLGFRLLDVLPVGPLLGTLVISLACAAPLLALAALDLNDIVTLAIGTALFAPVCVLALRVTGLIDDLDWGRLTKLLTFWRRPASARA